MSKIHEALKKAQEQRGANYPNGNLQAVEEIDPPPSPVLQQDVAATVTLSEPQLPVLQSGRDSFSTEDLRFESMVKNCSKPDWKLDPSAVVFGKSDVPKPGAEQFRTLRSRLAQIRETSSLKTILITSAVSGEGKTFVSSNLAQAIARQRERRIQIG